MSVANVISILDNLIQLHKALGELAVQKTGAIKYSDMETLDILLQGEQKHIKEIEQVEHARKSEVAKLLKTRGNEESNLFQELLLIVNAQEKERLIEQREQLLQIIKDLKNQNHLNQQLIYHSLQYINISLDALRPPQQADFNYTKPANTRKQSINRVMFDSKA